MLRKSGYNNFGMMRFSSDLYGSIDACTFKQKAVDHLKNEGDKNLSFARRLSASKEGRRENY